MVTKYGVNQFKIDGTGNVNQVFPGSLFDSDFSAAIHLIERLRQQDPGVFINLTTGTWPSPFWLRYADSIWRGGEDHSFDGVGSWRQKWITYRDEQTYRNVVEGGPLFPLNSLMLHGLIYAKEAEHLSTDPNHDFPDEVHSYFGSGTQLQEMYITPSLLSAQDWDVSGGGGALVAIQRRDPEGHALDRRRSSETPGIWLGFVELRGKVSWCCAIRRIRHRRSHSM